MKYLRNKIPNIIEIESDTISINKPAKLLDFKSKRKLIDKYLELGKSVNEICKELHMNKRTYNKLITKDSDDIHFKTNAEQLHETNLNRKIGLIEKVKKLIEKGYSYRKIANEVGIDRKTVKKYTDTSYNPINGNYKRYQKSILDPYIELIVSKILNGFTTKIIENDIRKKGYTGSSSTIRRYVSNYKKECCSSNNICIKKDLNTVKIKRSIILKCLFKPICDIKDIDEIVYDKICEKHKIFKIIHMNVWSLKNILLSGTTRKLDKFIEYNEKLKIRQLTSAINGIKYDIQAVYNSIKYPYSNGLAEGTVNKIKMVKRIMFGRNNFDTLKKNYYDLHIVNISTNYGKNQF